jgi:hypothetical protein
MATLDDVRMIVRELPDSSEVVEGHRGGTGWRAAKGLFVWERGPSQRDIAQLADLGRAWPDGIVVGVRTEGLEGKTAVLGAYADVAFDIPHFDGYPAVLVRLDAIDPPRLRELVTDSWLLRTSARAAKEWLAAHPG